jgi:hypothetical protein
MNILWRVAAALIAVASYAAVAAAQSAGNVSGVVRETSGGVLPGVVVTANGLSSEVHRTANTGERGRYEIDSLPRGRYQVTASVSGFEPVTAEVERLTVRIREPNPQQRLPEVDRTVRGTER